MPDRRTPDEKRTVQEAIERQYGYILARGCQNPDCSGWREGDLKVVVQDPPPGVDVSKGRIVKNADIGLFFRLRPRMFTLCHNCAERRRRGLLPQFGTPTGRQRLKQEFDERVAPDAETVAIQAMRGALTERTNRRLKEAAHEDIG